MNCKPGDLAIVVGSKTRHNLGKIVRVLREYRGGRVGGKLFHDSYITTPSWLVETSGAYLLARGNQGTYTRFLQLPFYDCYLRPLPDTLDEELTEQTQKELI